MTILRSCYRGIDMEKLFVTKLEIKKVRHLKDITINLSDTISRHLIFTGKTEVVKQVY